MAIPYYPGAKVSPLLGLSLTGMEANLAENFIILDSAVGSGGGGSSILLQTNSVNNAIQNKLNLIAGSNITLTADLAGGVTIASTGGGGSSVKVNGSSITNPNFNNTTPATVAGGVNVLWQFDGSGNVSAYVPNAEGGPFVQLHPTADQTITGNHALILKNLTEGAIVTSAVADAGNGYAPGDTGLVTPAGSTHAVYVVDTVNGSGEVVTYHFSDPGIGYTDQFPTNHFATSATSGAGTGFKIFITSVQHGPSFLVYGGNNNAALVSVIDGHLSVPDMDIGGGLEFSLYDSINGGSFDFLPSVGSLGSEGIGGGPQAYISFINSTPVSFKFGTSSDFGITVDSSATLIAATIDLSNPALFLPAAVQSYYGIAKPQLVITQQDGSTSGVVGYFGTAQTSSGFQNPCAVNGIGIILGTANVPFSEGGFFDGWTTGTAHAQRVVGVEAQFHHQSTGLAPDLVSAFYATATDTAFGTSANSIVAQFYAENPSSSIDVHAKAPIVSSFYSEDVGNNQYAFYADGTLSKVHFPVIEIPGSSSGKVTLQAAASAGSSNPLVLPTATGSSGQVLSTDGGNPQQLSWITISPGTGTVTSFSAGTLSPLFTTSVATPTTTPALTFALTNAGGGTVFGNNATSSGAPSYTTAPVLGIPGTSTGTIALASSTASGKFTITAPASASTPTLTLPTTSNVLAGQFAGDGVIFNTGLNVANAAGTLTPTLLTQTANFVLAGPTSGAAAAPTFRALVAADIPSGTVAWDQIANPTNSSTITEPATKTWTFNGTAPVTSSGSGTAAGTLLTVTTPVGGATTGSATTGGAGGDLAFTTGVGGDGSGGTNANGGRGGNVTFTMGVGGAKSGSGIAGVAGIFSIAGASNSITFDPKTGTINSASGLTLQASAGNISVLPVSGGSVTISGGISSVVISGTGNTGFTNKISKYANISTVSQGVPAEYATVDLTAQSAAITTTTLYAVPASGVGMYRVSVYAKITTAASTSSVLGGTNGFQVGFTDSTDSVAQTVGVVDLTNTSLSANSTTTVYIGSAVFMAKASTNITYAFDYTSVGVTPMQFTIHVKLEAL